MIIMVQKVVLSAYTNISFRNLLAIKVSLDICVVFIIKIRRTPNGL